MITVHVISDYYMGIHEFTNSVDEDLPESDLVIVVGNMGQIKRSMLYVETLCKKYPSKQFIINVGRTEDGLHQKNDTELSDGLTTRQLISEFWPKNLHYSYRKPITLTINERKIDLLCLHGFPHIIEESVNDATWKSTSWYKYATHGVTFDQSEFKLKEAADVYHGWFSKFSTPERCREDHAIEHGIVNEWLHDKEADTTKILVTALGPDADPCLTNIDYVMYPNSDPDIWIASGRPIENRTNHTMLYSNPGRSDSARKSVLII
jgi:hypothetical protein